MAQGHTERAIGWPRVLPESLFGGWGDVGLGTAVAQRLVILALQLGALTACGGAPTVRVPCVFDVDTLEWRRLP